MRKIIFAILLCALLFTGCGNQDDAEAEAKSQKADTQQEPNVEADAETESRKTGQTAQRTDETQQETGETTEESNTEVLSEEAYYIGEDKFRFVLSEENGEYSLTLFCNIEDKSDAYYTHISLNSIMESEEEGIKPLKDILTYSISIGDGTFLFRNKEQLTLLSENNETISKDDYFSVDWLLDEAEESDYGEQVADFLVDFMENA